MVFSNAKQPRDSYLLWKRFRFPVEGGTRDAVAVPKTVADQLNAAYSSMITFMMVHFWTVVIGVLMYAYVRRKGAQLTNLHPMAVTFWNARADLIDTVWDIAAEARENASTAWLWALLLVVVVALWVGQTAMGVLVPPLLLLGGAAPADPNALYVPSQTRSDLPSIAKKVALEIPWAFRALGVADADESELREKVQVDDAVNLGTDRDSGGDVLRIDYRYKITASDWGLQGSEGLTLRVSGSCTTNYSAYLGETTEQTDNVGYIADVYELYGVQQEVSLLDGVQPMGFFYAGPPPPDGSGNATWSALASAVNRTSFTPGTDPWYLTDPTDANDTQAPGYMVRSGRPALSCWQDDVWSLNGRNATVGTLTTDLGAGAVSDSIAAVMLRYLSPPMIRTVGSRLGASSLRSSTTAIEGSFEAGTSSLRADLERLVIASYVASANIFTDATLYPSGADAQLPNQLLDASGRVPDDAAAFVVYSEDAAALSVAVLASIPSVLLAVWLLSIALMHFSRVRLVRALDGGSIMTQALEADPNAKLIDEKDGPKIQMTVGSRIQGPEKGKASNTDADMAQDTTAQGTSTQASAQTSAPASAGNGESAAEKGEAKTSVTNK